MAEQKFQPQNTSQVDTDLFVKGMTKDPNASLVGQQNWSHARNAINNSKDGDVGTIGNEPANLQCVVIPYTIIGTIYLYGDKWVIFSTDDTSSEIGMFDDSHCTYETIVNDVCLNFNKLHLITGASKENFDCSWQIYWDDGNNPSRTLNLDNIPWVLRESSAEGADCVTYEIDPPQRLNCEWIRLAPLVDVPCVVVNKNKDGGQLRNGAYQAYIAYVVNEQKVGDFIGISNVQTLFDHEDTAGSLDIHVTNLDKEFKFYGLVIVSNNQGQMQAKQIGLYSTEQERISIDYIDQKLPSVPLSTIPLRNPAYEKSDKMYIVNDYLLRQGPYENFDFNYQPLANLIESNWISTQYPADYYSNGGNKPTFMRDEQYAFFIRFVYNTGERSQSYHIPGRPPNSTSEAGTGVFGIGLEDDETRDLVGGANVLSVNEPFWRGKNTASWNNGLPGASIGDTTDDGGTVVAKGKMGYWESSEQYPATDPVRWDDLCGLPIRHHKMPDELTCPFTQRNSSDAQSIFVLGVEFNNIAWPVDNQNPPQPISNLVGYEILVGAREGNKSIVAKGLLRNMRGYDLEDDNEGATEGLIANFPFNDLRTDPYHVKDCTITNDGGGRYGSDYSKDDFYTFHSPETSFNHVYLNPFEVRSYGVNSGYAFGRFYKSEKHPGAKLLRDASAIIAAFIGAGYAIQQMRGERVEKVKKVKTKSVAKDPGPIYDVKRGREDGIDHGDITAGGYTLSGTTTSGTTSVSFAPLGIGFSGDTTTTSYSLNYGSQNITQDPTDYTGYQADDADWNFSGTTGFQTPGHQLEKGQTESPNNEYYQDSAQAAVEGQAQDDSTLLNPPATPQVVTIDGQTVTYPNQATNLADAGVPLDNQLRESVQTFGSVISPGIFEETYMNQTRKVQEQVHKKTPGSESPEKSVETKGTRVKALPNLIEWMQGLMTFLTLMADGGQVIIDLIYNMSSYNDHAIKYSGHGLYYITHAPSGSKYSPANIYRSRIDKARYVKDSFQNIDATNKINNLFRPATVAIKTDDNTGLTLPNFWGAAPTDNSRFTVGNPTGLTTITYENQNPQRGYLSTISAHYVALKLNFDNQYGQLDGIRQIPIRGCIDYFDPEYDSNVNIINPNIEERYGTQVLFGGDCYINRYTEKNIKPFFWDFLYDQPDGFPYNYKLRQNSPCPRYWMNTQKYDMSGMVAPIMDLTFDFSGGMAGTGALPSAYYNLDRGDPLFGDATGGEDADASRPGPGSAIGSLFIHKKGYMYTHSSGIQDFFVESELNMAHRDWEDRDGERHYDWLENTDIKGLFDAKIIKDGNFYKYDNSLSKNKLFSQLISYGTIQPRDYNPLISEYCYVHYPKRLIYSLQAHKEAKMDFWRVFLPNNYKDFKNQVNVIKPISKNGAIIFFPHLSPQMFQGVDQLTTDLNTKITIGDGGLFTSIPQTNVTNADLPHEYGSCESARSVVNTPSGLFYISQAQGKVFQYGGQGITNIANNGMKQWFNKYLPSRLLESFPEIEKLDEIIDNPVVGVGCQSVYDPNYDIVYFCKKDYEPIHRECMVYEPGVGFIYSEALCGGEDATIYECPPETILIEVNGEWLCQCQGEVFVPNTMNEGYDQITGDWITPEQQPCPLDIMISVDASYSLYENGNTSEMRELILGFLGYYIDSDGLYAIDEDNPGFRPGIESGEIRIGFVGWGMDLLGQTISSDYWATAEDQLGESAGPAPLKLTSDINVLLEWVSGYYTYILNEQSQFTNHAVGLWEGLDMLYNPGWDITDEDGEQNDSIYPSYEHARLGVNKVLIFLTDGFGNLGGSPSSGYPLASDGVMLPDVPYQSTLRPRLSYPGDTDSTNRLINNSVDDACKDDGNMGGCDTDDYIRGWQINGFVANDADTDIEYQYAKAPFMPLRGLDGGYVSRGRCKDWLDTYYAVDPDVDIVIPTSPIIQNFDDSITDGKIYTTPVMGSDWKPYSECDAEPYGISTYSDITDYSALGSQLANWWNNFVIGDVNGINSIAADNRKVIYAEDDLVNKWGSLTVYPIFLKNPDAGDVTNAEVNYIEQYASHPKWENSASGQFEEESIRSIVDGLTNRFCPLPEPVWDAEAETVWVDATIVLATDADCPPGYSLTSSIAAGDPVPDNLNWTTELNSTLIGTGGIICTCNTFSSPETSTDGFQVDLDDPEYFRDLSWTVSYDPKIQGWISFHDWHPELTMPSLNHFLTTKTGPAETPHCPPGYYYNEDNSSFQTGQCCQDGQYQQPADITLEYGTLDYEEVPWVNYVPGPETEIYRVSLFATQYFNESMGIWACQDRYVAAPAPYTTMQIGWLSPAAYRPTAMGPTAKPQWFITDAGGLPQSAAVIFPEGVFNWVNTGDTTSNGVLCNPMFGDNCPSGTYWGGGLSPYQWPYSHPSGPYTDLGLMDRYTGLFVGASVFTGDLPADGWALPDPDNPGQFLVIGTAAPLPINSTGDMGLQTGVQYRLKIRLRIPKATWPVSSYGVVGYDECGWPGGQICADNDVKLVIWGGDDAIATDGSGGLGSIYNQNDNNVKLGEIIINNENANSVEEGKTKLDWVDYEIIFVPDVDCKRIMLAPDVVDDFTMGFVMASDLRLYSEEPGSGTTTSGINYFCDCPTGYTMVDENGNPTDICRETNQCVKTNCDCPVVDGNIAVSEEGVCDTYEQYMGLDINPFPFTCHYDFVSCVEPSLEIGGIWKHNVRCDLFANYYTQQYPWEIELVSSMGQTVEMLRSVEYQLEVFDYITNYAKDAAGNNILTQPLNLNCEDRYQELTYNFNEAIIWNNEQISGLLKLEMQPSDPPLITTYPIIGGADIRILYDKVEQQFRFDQFWDITDDRNVSGTQFITQMNGYIRDLNADNMNYNKAAMQHKKFRYYFNKVLLRRMPIEDGLDNDGNMTYKPETRKMLLKLVNTKLNHSFR